MKMPEPQVYRPQHLNELLTLYSRHPDACLLAGGTAALGSFALGATPEILIDLTTAQELKRIRRTDRFMDIGPALSISRILSTGRHVIPRVLYDALSSAASYSLRNVVTLGGNICQASPYSSPLTALYALESRLELRTSGASRWLPVTRFITGDGETNLRSGEILTAIRIPFGEWNLGIFRKISTQSSLSPPALTFCGLARLAKQEIQDLRIAIGSVNRTVIRNRKLESPLVGHKIPLSDREIEAVTAELSSLLEPIADSYSTAEYRGRTAVRLLRWFLRELNQYHIYSF